MNIDEQVIQYLENKYGKPRTISIKKEFGDRGFDILIGSMKDARSHDVTLFIKKEGKFVVIQKPSYPAGAYRTPSGGVKEGETFEQGAKREAFEETGLIVELERYILRVYATFVNRGKEVKWTSHVFTALCTGGELEVKDKKEISIVRLASIEEIKTTIRDALLSSGVGGLQYRSELTDAAIEEIEKYSIN